MEDIGRPFLFQSPDGLRLYNLWRINLNIIKRTKTFIEVVGDLPTKAKRVGAGVKNSHCNFISILHKVL